MDNPHELAARRLELPPPGAGGELGALLRQRHSTRKFSAAPLGLSDVAALLWAAQGAAGRNGHRVTPSAGGLYPLEVLLVAGLVEGMTAGVYRYAPATHDLTREAAGEFRPALAAASWGQAYLAEAPAVIALTATYGRTTIKYGERGVRYAQMEAGHAAQSLCLMATALGLDTVVIGAFDDAAVGRVLRLAPDETPLELLPVGAGAGRQPSANPGPRSPR